MVIRKRSETLTESSRRYACPPGASMSLCSVGLSNSEFNLSEPQFFLLLNERVGPHDF